MSIDFFGVSGVAAIAIPFIIEGLKKIGIPTKICPAAAFALGIIVGIAGFILHFAGDMSLIQAIIAGIGIGGVSTGLYDLQQSIGKK